MMFIQEDYLSSFTTDVEAQNDVMVSIRVSNADIEKIMDDYDTLIPIFAENVEAITVDMILAYIGEKIVLS